MDEHQNNRPKAYPKERAVGNVPKPKPRNRNRDKGSRVGRPPGTPNPHCMHTPLEMMTKGAATGLDELDPSLAGELTEILKGLSLMEANFCLEYMIDMNAKQAATRAGYSPISISGCIVLNRPRVRAAIDSLLEIRARNQALVANRLLIGLDELAHLDINEIYEDDGCIKLVKDWPPIHRQALMGFKVKEIWLGDGEDKKQVGRMVDVRFVDPLKARELLGRHMKLWAEPSVSVSQTNITNTQVNVSNKFNLSAIDPEKLKVAVALGLARIQGNVVEVVKEDKK